ncbi:hypothetical protein TELCIR_14723, partial [Teladorsagia circumcincta]
MLCSALIGSPLRFGYTRTYVPWIKFGSHLLNQVRLSGMPALNVTEALLPVVEDAKESPICEKKMFAYPAFGLRNKYLENVEDDYLYHFGFGLKTVDLPKTFGDVKFVCTGGSPTRLKLYAEWFSKECKMQCSENLSKSDRFVMYKTGPVLWINVLCIDRHFEMRRTFDFHSIVQ